MTGTDSIPGGEDLNEKASQPHSKEDTDSTECYKKESMMLVKLLELLMRILRVVGRSRRE
jgi:hypothetical protein